MSNEYSLYGKSITMRRLFKYDIKKIPECFEDYRKLFFFPVTEQFAENVFLQGEFWGAFVNDTVIACSYLYPLDCSFSAKQERYDLIADFTARPEEYMLLGYVGFLHGNISKFISYSELNTICASIYKAFLNIAEMQAFRYGKKHVMHCLPLKLGFDLSPLFDNGYCMTKLRGLEKLVVHYIFSKPVYNGAEIYVNKKGESHRVALSNTKALSRFLENGYMACEMLSDKGESVLTVYKSISD